MAYIYDMLSKPGAFGADKALRAKYATEKEAALNAALTNGDSYDLHLMRAEVYVDQGKYDKALEDLSLASDSAYNDPSTHERIISLCRKMGTAKAATQMAVERKWMAEFQKNNAATSSMAVPSR
jgi:thioredoxin-like negative regulator of GroEL